jgi:hypothetical protein
MDFTITITEDNLLAGLTSARDAYNNALALEEDQVLEDHDDYKATDLDYVQFVMTKACESYANQYGN